MKHKITFLFTKIKLSVKTIFWILQKKRYLLLSALIAFLFFELIYWIFNINILIKIIPSVNVSIIEKFQVLFSPVESIIATNGNVFLMMMIFLSIIQGISLSMIIYTVRHQEKIDDAVIGENSIITLLAIIGLGCPSCGTSLITPIVAAFVSGSSVIISERINTFVIPIALIISIFSLYSIGLKASSIRVKSDN